jgi:cytochrome c peroxidase
MNSRILIALALAACIQAQPLRSLKSVPVAAIPGLETYVRDKDALVALGKALFWDMQAGSDGRTACASCHFHAGADHRSQNLLADPNNPFTPNVRLTADHFPLRQLSDPGNRNSVVLRDASARVGSTGLFQRVFSSVLPAEPAEAGEDAPDPSAFQLGGLQVRRVTTRNSPSVINAVFYIRNFWDGRAQRIFNGATPSGNAADAPGALVLRDGQLVREPVRLDNASLASQATGPILDHVEMSYAGRTWTDLARKLLPANPLALQRVAPDDSVLGPLARIGGRGLAPNYRDLILSAFQPALTDGGDPQMEANFSLFWGLSLHAYQSTLVSNDSPFDRFQEGDPAALTAQEQEGMRLFQNQGRCATCHGGAEFSAAVFSNNNGGRGGNRAFQRTGVRPAAEDIGSGNGNFKSIGLRNVELTGPYFHNGGQATLEQVIDFYARGGDFANGDIRPFNMSGTQKAALAAFLRALTDERVRHERAPFDHPELCVPNGHPELQPGVLIAALNFKSPRTAVDLWVGLPEVGASGHPEPLQTFEELLQGIGGDGARANAMTATCAVPLP